MEVTSIMDNGWEWQAREDFAKDSSGGEVLVLNAERCESEEWQRWTLESNSLSSPIPLYSFHVFSSDWPPNWTDKFSLFNALSGLETSRNLLFGVVTGDFSLSSFLHGETQGNCSSNAFRYNERRYCSKCPTSNSKTAISLINSVAGWSHIKPL